MSFNLLDAVKGHFNSDMISKAASFLGESEGGISKALGGIIPSVLSGLTSKASSSHGAEEVAAMAKDSHSSGLLGNLSGFLGNGDLLGQGANLVKGLFGGKLGGIVDAISGFAGIKGSSATSLMSMAAPATLGTIGKHASDNNLGASGIASLLSGSKSLWSGLLPAGISSLLGGTVSSIAGGAKEAASTVTNYADDAADTARGGVRWLVPLLLLAALGFLAWWLLQNKGCSKKADDTHTTVPGGDTLKKTGGDTLNLNAGVRESMKVKLANGVEIDAYKGGIEGQLVAFLDDKAAVLDSNGKWFDFDNLNFKLGKSDLTDSSMVQINNIVAILKAYPAVKMKIGGYTDASGNAASNQKLSQSRADAVKAAIEKAGGNVAQLTGAEGYGSKFAKEPATASEEARKKDRRTAVKIVSK
jgi:outer membrane protein OmpA-like peptidoglycan-associated protein